MVVQSHGIHHQYLQRSSHSHHHHHHHHFHHPHNHHVADTSSHPPFPTISMSHPCRSHPNYTDGTRWSHLSTCHLIFPSPFHLPSYTSCLYLSSCTGLLHLSACTSLHKPAPSHFTCHPPPPSSTWPACTSPSTYLSAPARYTFIVIHSAFTLPGTSQHTQEDFNLCNS